MSRTAAARATRASTRPSSAGRGTEEPAEKAVPTRASRATTQQKKDNNERKRVAASNMVAAQKDAAGKKVRKTGQFRAPQGMPLHSPVRGQDAGEKGGALANTSTGGNENTDPNPNTNGNENLATEADPNEKQVGGREGEVTDAETNGGATNGAAPSGHGGGPPAARGSVPAAARGGGRLQVHSRGVNGRVISVYKGLPTSGLRLSGASSVASFSSRSSSSSRSSEFIGLPQTMNGASIMKEARLSHKARQDQRDNEDVKRLTRLCDDGTVGSFARDKLWPYRKMIFNKNKDLPFGGRTYTELFKYVGVQDMEEYSLGARQSAWSIVADVLITHLNTKRHNSVQRFKSKLKGE